MIAPLSLKKLQQEFSWELVGRNCSFISVSIDTRTLQAGDLYIALTGENFDGHQFVDAAIELGACAVLVSKKQAVDVPQLVMSDTRVGLAMLANLVRRQFKGVLIGLTGSAGKTTTKEMLAEILSGAGNVLATQGNLNNEIGVPLTLLQLNKKHDYAVIEMGASHPGDIRYLVEIAQPDIAMLLNAKAVHIEGFGSIEGVAQTKAEIFEGLLSQSHAVINLDDEFAPQWRQKIDLATVVSFSFDSKADVSASDIQLSATGVTFNLNIAKQSLVVSLAVPGKHNVANAMAAAAAAHSTGLAVETIVQGLNNFSGVNSRLNQFEGVNGCTVIDDSYNANPDAMMAAIDVLTAYEGNHILVMGDMGELGLDAEKYHFSVGEYAKQHGVNKVFAVGELSRHVVAGFGLDAQWFETKQKLSVSLNASLNQCDVVLVKGSRSAAMEQVVSQITVSSQHNAVGS